MKIRMQGNSLRFRLSEAEVQQLGSTGQVEEIIIFGPSPAEKQHYILSETSEVKEINLLIKENKIIVQIPSGQALIWVNSNQTSLSKNIPNGQPNGLKILVEKDLDCSHEK